MLPILLGLFFLGGALILQMTVVSQLPLLYGTADIVLLTLLGWILHERVPGAWQWGILAGLLVGVASALPIWLPLASYALVTALAIFLQRRVWQLPIVSLFVMTAAGSLLVPGLTFAYLSIIGTPLEFSSSLNLIILPGVLLNTLLALPMYVVLGEVAKWLYPPEVET